MCNSCSVKSLKKIHRLLQHWQRHVYFLIYSQKPIYKHTCHFIEQLITDLRQKPSWGKLQKQCHVGEIQWEIWKSRTALYLVGIIYKKRGQDKVLKMTRLSFPVLDHLKKTKKNNYGFTWW